MPACELHRYYDYHPSHKAIIKKVPAFCKEHPGLLMYTPDGTGGQLSLPSHCCLFLQKSCTGKHSHQGLMHVDLPAGAVHCQCGTQCPVGHWKQIEAQAKAGLGRGKGSGKAVPAVTSKGTQHLQNSNGKATPKPLAVAANLALFIDGNGGVVLGDQVNAYYTQFPAHKEIISKKGLKNFCAEYDGFFEFVPGLTWSIKLASYCCRYLGNACNHLKDHGGKRHSRPSSSLAICNFRSACKMGHWKPLLKLAATPPSGASQSFQAVEQSGSDSEDVASEFLWCHNSTRVVFQDVRLVSMMLKELLDGNFLLGQTQNIDVSKDWDDGVLYAWTGNRRLWVLEELERLTSRKITARAKKYVNTKTNEGVPVTFFTDYLHRNFPSMVFALAALRKSTAPNPWDVQLGRLIRDSKYACPMYKVEQMAASLRGVRPRGDLKEYLLQKKHLFYVDKGVVTLTNPIDAIKHLERDLRGATTGLAGNLEDAKRPSQSTSPHWCSIVLMAYTVRPLALLIICLPF